MQKYLFALILVGMIASGSSPVVAQTPLPTPEKSTTPSNQTDSLRHLIDSANNKIQKGEYQAARLELNKAIADFNQTVAVNPQDPEVYNSRGKFYADIFSGSRSETKTPLPLFSNSIQDAQHKAFKDYDMAIKLNPKIAIYYYNRGSLHIEIRKIYGVNLFGLFGDSEKNLAINDLKIAAKIFLEAGDEKNYRFVMQTIDKLN